MQNIYFYYELVCNIIILCVLLVSMLTNTSSSTVCILYSSNIYIYIYIILALNTSYDY